MTVLRHSPVPDLEAGRGGRVGLPVRIYAVSLLLIALTAVAALAATGAAFPPPGEMLLLAILLGLCMNRFVFFPNEVGVTADAAVIFAAMVAFRGDALWLGPLLAALLVGPLDAKHWEERAFVRMAYNSGSTAIVALAALAVFVPVSASLGTSFVATLTAAAPAAVAALLAETALGVALVSFQGEHVLVAARHQLSVNTVALPLSLYGAACGVAALEVGWWLAFVLLLPVPVVPELALVEVPRRLRGAHRAAFLGEVALGALLAALVVVFPFPPAAQLAALLAVAVLVGAESRVTARDPVPALTAVVVVASLVVVRGEARFLAATLVSTVASFAAWAIAGARAPWRVPVLSALGALVGAGAFALARPDDGGSGRALMAAVVAGTWCLVVTDRRRSTATWCLPIVAASGAWALLWVASGAGGALVFLTGTSAMLGAAAAWGTPVWRSRNIGPWASRHLGSRRRTLLLLAAAAAIVTAATFASTAGEEHFQWLLTGVVFAQVDLAMALMAVRQWRFAPRRRAAEAAVLAVGSLAVCVAAAIAGPVIWLVTTIGVVTLAVLVGWPVGALEPLPPRSESSTARRL